MVPGVYEFEESKVVVVDFLVNFVYKFITLDNVGDALPFVRSHRV